MSSLREEDRGWKPNFRNLLLRLCKGSPIPSLAEGWRGCSEEEHESWVRRGLAPEVGVDVHHALCKYFILPFYICIVFKAVNDLAPPPHLHCSTQQQLTVFLINLP